MAKVLIIEDNAEDFERIAEFLKNKGFQIVSAKNAYEGLYQFDKESPDMVILDLNIPGLPGVEVCRTMKEKKKQVPILLLTIQSQLQHKREGFEAGCDDYLVKPCDVEELLARVQYLLGKIKKQAPQKLLYGDIVLDPETHRVTKAGKVIDLSLTEYSLLEFLMQNVDQVLSRKAILEHVWGTNNPDTFTNIVDVYMNYLRKKLDAPGRRSLIKTVRGFGYMLEDLSLRKAA